MSVHLHKFKFFVAVAAFLFMQVNLVNASTERETMDRYETFVSNVTKYFHSGKSLLAQCDTSISRRAGQIWDQFTYQIKYRFVESLQKNISLITGGNSSYCWSNGMKLYNEFDQKMADLAKTCTGNLVNSLEPWCSYADNVISVYHENLLTIVQKNIEMCHFSGNADECYTKAIIAMDLLEKKAEVDFADFDNFIIYLPSPTIDTTDLAYCASFLENRLKFFAEKVIDSVTACVNIQSFF